MTSRLKKIIIFIALIGIGYFSYNMFFAGQENNGPLISGGSGLTGARNLADTQVLGQQITQALIQIESLRLDRGIFDNPIFVSLNDRSEEIISEPIGRTNPFAPLSNTSVNYSEDQNDSLETDDLGDEDLEIAPDDGMLPFDDDVILPELDI